MGQKDPGGLVLDSVFRQGGGKGTQLLGCAPLPSSLLPPATPRPSFTVAATFFLSIFLLATS